MSCTTFVSTACRPNIPACMKDAKARGSERHMDVCIGGCSLTRRCGQEKRHMLQLGSGSQDPAGLCAAQKLEAAKKEGEASSAQVMRLEIELAEARKALQAAAELEKEVQHYRCRAPASRTCLVFLMHARST